MSFVRSPNSPSRVKLVCPRASKAASGPKLKQDTLSRAGELTQLMRLMLLVLKIASPSLPANALRLFLLSSSS